MKGKSLWAGIVIVVLAVASGFGWFIGNQQKLEAASYGFFHEQGAQLVVNFGQIFVWLNSYGQELSAIDLVDFGVQSEGDFEFFSNGDLLIYHRASNPSLWQNLKRYHRVKETTVKQRTGSDGFYRCQLALKTCQPFGINLPVINGSFRLAVDTRSDTVYLAHSSAFTVYKIDSAGEIVAESDSTTFKFPNQLWFTNNQLWLADTNNHRLVQLSTDTETFAGVEQEFKAELSRQHRWPHQFASDGETFWVNIADGGMANGRIGIYDRAGKEQGELTAVQGKDPMAVYLWQDILWLTDFSEPLFERFSADGDVLADVSAPTLERLTKKSREQVLSGTHLSNLGGIALIIVMLAGFWAAWLLERQQTVAALTGQASEALQNSVSRPIKEHDGSNVLWINNKLLVKARYLKWVFILLPILIVGALSLLAFELMNDESSSFKVEHLTIFSAMAAFMALLMLYSYKMVQNMAMQKVGVIGSSIVLQRSEKQSTIARAESIHYNDSYLLADNIIISLGNKNQRVFDGTELNEWVFPRLKEATAISNFSVFKKMWDIKEPMFIAGLSIFTVVILMALALEILA